MRDSGRLSDLLKQVSNYLENSRRASELVLVDFENDAFEATKAYINVLESWGYPYGWSTAVGHLNDPALVITVSSKPALILKKSELLYLQGRPLDLV